MATQVNKQAVFCAVVNQAPQAGDRVADILRDLDAEAQRVHGPNVSSGALNNCHGDWFEWLLTITAWNTFVTNNTDYVAFTVPNIAQFDAMSLYVQDLYNMVTHLRAQVRNATNVSLVTSNPDFVIVDALRLPPTVQRIPITGINAATLDFVNTLHQHFVHSCGYQDIKGYSSVKVSFRPDRRLQIPHEGSLVKAIHVHLQTRQWIINAEPLKYYAAAVAVTDADINALRTVATHSITNVNSQPQSAVDDVFALPTIGDAERMYQQILNP